MRSLFLLILLIPIFAFAEDVDIRVRYPTGQIKPEKINLGSPAQRAWMNNAFKSGDAWYADEKLNARMFTEMGAKANSTMPVVVQNKVAKKSVMRGLLANARAGGRLASRNPWVFIAFTLVGDKLFDEASDMVFQWDNEAGDFVTTADYAGHVTSNGTKYGEIGFSTLQISTGASTYSGKVRTACTNYESKVQEQYNSPDFKLDKMTGSSAGGAIGQYERSFTCLYVSQTAGYAWVNISIHENNKRSITQQEFDDIMIPIADNGPSEYVNASRPSQNAQVPDSEYEETRAVVGTSVQTNPYTDPVDGKAKEAKFTINSDGTSATITIQNRPDLQGDTEAAPVPEPLPETKPDTGGETTPETEQTPFCELYPDVLACQKMGDGSEAESIFSDIKIPEITNPAEFKLDNFLPDNGSCPAPKTYSTSHGSIIYSYEKHCDVARTLRPFLIAFASVTALYLIFFRKA